MKIAESLILESPEQEAQMYADLFPEIHPDIKKEDEKIKKAWQIKQAWLDGFESGKQFEKNNESSRNIK
jgi:hypothetical protein